MENSIVNLRLPLFESEQLVARLKLLGNNYNQHSKNNKSQVLEQNLLQNCKNLKAESFKI